MKEVAVGIALMWLITTIRGTSTTVKGVPSIMFALFIAWGLGHIFFGLVK